MKKLTGLVIILAVLVLGGYYGMGFLAEKTIKKNIEIINQSNGLFAEIEQYHRGLFDSEAKIKWRMHIPERSIKDANGQDQTVPAQDYAMEMPLTIHHGPVIFANNQVKLGLGFAQTVLSFPPQYKEQFDASFTSESTKPQLDLSIYINYLNESTVDFKVPGFKLTAKDGSGNFEWMGLDASTTISAGMKKIAGKIAIDGINASKDDTKINLGKVTSDYDLHETPAGLYLGDANFMLPVFDVFVKDQKMFEVVDLALKSDSDIEQHLFNTHFNLTVKSVLADGQTYGPGDIEVALRNLDADVLAKINQQTTAIQNGNDMQRQQAMLAMLPELPKLFAKGTEFEVSKLSLKIPQGQIEGTLVVSLPKGENANPFELMQKIHGNAKLKIPAMAMKQMMQQSVIQQIGKQPELQQKLIKELQESQTLGQTDQQEPTVDQLAAMQVEKQLGALQQTGFVTVQGSDYLMEVSLEQGKFTVNGKPFDSSTLKF